ncbi:MAG: hypothetical protein ACKOW2_05695 [Sphingobacteriaceae bacterium]
MKNIEEQMWKYVSGTCSAIEQEELEQLMTHQPEYRALFQEISATHLALMQLELEEPSMSFERNVMEQIKLEPLPSRFPQVDQRIIRGIAGFFALSILSLLVYAFYLTDWTQAALNFKMPEFNWDIHFNKTILSAFLFIDMILGLYFLDYLLRKKWQAK